MESEDVFYNKQEYIETASGNKVSRQSVLCGSQNIVLNGKTIIQSECVIRGDLANVRIGRHCVISKRAVIRPPFKKFSKGVAFFPLHVGDHVFIDEDTVVNAAHVGSYVYIGKNCVISEGKIAVYVNSCDFKYALFLPPDEERKIYPLKHIEEFSIFMGRRCVLKDCSMIADNTVLPQETVVPAFSMYASSPGVYTKELPECTQDLMMDFTKGYYQHFKPLIQN